MKITKSHLQIIIYQEIQNVLNDRKHNLFLEAKKLPGSSMEFLLSEAKAKIRSETRDLSRLVMQAVKMNVNDTIAKQKKLRLRSGIEGWPFMLQQLLTVSDKDLPTSLQKLGVKEVRVRFTPSDNLPRGKFKGSGFFSSTGASTARATGPKGPTIEINIHYPRETPASGFIRNYSNIYHEIQEIVHHELRHMWQSLHARHLWWGASAVSTDYRKNYFHYLMTEHETDSWIRGLAYRAKKTRRAKKNPLITFEYLIDQELLYEQNIGRLTKRQAKRVRKKWMDHAMRQIPCSLNSKGLPINPKGCGFSEKRKKERANKKKLRRLQQEINDNPKKRAQLKKELASFKEALEAGVAAGGKPGPGQFKKIISRLPIIGRIMAWSAFVGFTIHGADQAYASGGAEALAKYSASTLVDLTPIIGDIKGIVELMRMVKPRPIPPEIRNMIGHPSSRYR